ncbi:MAG: hypothetical protein WBC71_14640, partial [Salaquimonas sp.]
MKLTEKNNHLVPTPPKTEWFANATWIFATGLLMMIGGSVGTAVFFGAAAIVLFNVSFLGKPFIFPREARFAVTVSLFLFLTKVPSAIFFENQIEALKILGSNLQLITIALLICGLLQTPKIDYMRLYLRAFSIGLPIAFITGIVQRTMLKPLRLEGAMGNTLVYVS